jgi:hypothetical protein
MKFPRVTAAVDPPGPNTRAVLEHGRTQADVDWSAPQSAVLDGLALCRRCGITKHGHDGMWSTTNACLSFEEPMDHDLAQRAAAKREREAQAMELSLTVDQLLADAKANLLVLRTLHNVPISDAQIEERANNLIQGLIGNYEIKRRP